MLAEVTVKQSCTHSITYNTGRECLVLSTCSVVHGKEVSFHGKTSLLTNFIALIAFRLLPFPLEQGHRHEPYPASTTNLDKEILPGKRFLYNAY